jgi:hypothetical protein
MLCLAFTAQAAPTSQPSGKSLSMCQAMMSGATLTSTDTPSGVTVDITVPAAQVDDLRTHVRAMADMHEHMAGGAHSEKMKLPPADLQVTDIDGGSRVTFTAKDPADVDALRTRVAAHVAMMRAGGCAHETPEK